MAGEGVDCLTAEGTPNKRLLPFYRPRMWGDVVRVKSGKVPKTKSEEKKIVFKAP